MFSRALVTVSCVAALAAGTLSLPSPAGAVAPAGDAVPSGAVAEVTGLVAGPQLTPSGATAWIESTDTRWRLRTASDGGKAKTLAQGSFADESDYDSGEIYREGIGAVTFAGERALIEHTMLSGTAKYFQYVHTSKVAAYSTVTGRREAPDLLACSVHEDRFGGGPPNPPAVPSASFTIEGDHTVATLCDKTEVVAGIPSDRLGGDLVYATQGCKPTWTILRVTTPDPAPRALACANLDFRKARRTGRTLAIRVKLDPAATGALTVTYRAAGRTSRRALTPTAGTAEASLRLPRWALGQQGHLTVTYAGDGSFLRQIVKRSA